MKIGSILAAASIAIGAVAAFAEPEHVQRELIVGGDVIPQGSKTYNVGLRYTVGGNTICGGVLISPYHVMTSPSCVPDDGLPGYVAVGTHYFNGSEDGEYFKVVSSENHPDVDIANGTYMFAILTLNKPSTHTPIQLPNATDSGATTGTMLKVMGWGEMEYPFVSPSRELRGVDLPMTNSTACLKYYRYIGPTNFCAGGTGTGPCITDLGGPLVKEGENGNPDILIGLAMSGIGCAIKGIPGVYSRVSAGLDWITSVISRVSNNALTPVI